MNILIVVNSKLPVIKYGGTQRIMWWLAEYYTKIGHKVTFLAKPGTLCTFADVIIRDETKTLNEQIPQHIDIVHFNSTPKEEISKPFIVSIRGNGRKNEDFHINTCFLSKNHANRHNSNCFVYNGLNSDDYGKPNFEIKREHLLFLGKASWKVKNLKGCIDISKKAKRKLAVIGGKRLNFKMGWRFTTDFHVKFHGELGGVEKNNVIKKSSALLFPVLWHEPFGIAIIEALYFGMPVFGTTYGSLPEIVTKEVGFLSNNSDELIENIKNLEDYDRKKCHEYICDNFSIKNMAEGYLKLYEKVLNGETLNQEKPFVEKVYPKLLPMK